MGIYIQELLDGTPLPKNGKADVLLQLPGAKQIYPSPTKWEDDIICVVENGDFDAAAYVFSQQEMDAFNYSDPRRPDRRRKTWIKIAGAAKLTPYGEMAREEAAGRLPLDE